MPKNAIQDYDVTPEENVDIGGIPLAEGAMRMRDINNALRTSMAHQKVRDDAISAQIEKIDTGIQTNSISDLVFSTRAELDAYLDEEENVAAIVYGDSATDDGLYRKLGAAGAGSWTRLGAIPGQTFVIATENGSSVNALVVSIDTTIAENKLIAVPTAQTNTSETVTVTINGEGPYTLRSPTNALLPIGALTAGGEVIGRIVGNDFRLVSDYNTLAAAAAVEAARAETAQSASDASTSASEAAQSASQSLASATAAGVSSNQSATSATQAALSQSGAQQAYNNAITAAEASGDVEFVDTFADMTAAAFPDDTVVMVFADETRNGQNSRYRIESGSPVYKPLPDAYTDTLRVVTATQLGLVANDNSPAVKTANDTAGADAVIRYSNFALVVLMDGDFKFDEGWYWHDRILPICFIGTVPGAGATCQTVSKFAIRVRGQLNGLRTPGVRFENMNFRGFWNAANNWEKGVQPFSGVVGEASWVWASPVEVAYANNVEFIDCNSEDSGYDLYSAPIAINGIKFVRCTGRIAQDDGINPGGVPQDEALSVYGVYIVGCLLEYVRGVAYHLSGSCFGAVVRNCVGNYCGRGVIDWSEGGHDIFDVTGDMIGQPADGSALLAQYPGSTDSNGEPWASQFAAMAIACLTSSRNALNVKAKGIRFTRVFEGRNRGNAYMANLQKDGRFVENLELDLVVDNSGMDPAVFDNSQVQTLFSGSGANDTLSNSSIRMRVKFDAANPGGKTSLNFSGETNKFDIEVQYSSASYAIEFKGNNIKGSRFSTPNCAGGQIISGQGIEDNVHTYTNANPLPTSTRIGIFIGASNFKPRSCDLTDGKIQLAANLEGLELGKVTLRNTGFAFPEMIINLFGSPFSIDLLRLAFEPLETGVSSANGWQNRLPNCTIKWIEGYHLSGAGRIFQMDNSNAENLRIGGGDLEIACLFLQSPAGIAAGPKINNLTLHSRMTSGHEIQIQSSGSNVKASINRVAAHAESPVSVSGSNNVIDINGTNLGAAGIEDTGTNNAIRTLVA